MNISQWEAGQSVLLTLQHIWESLPFLKSSEEKSVFLKGGWCSSTSGNQGAETRESQ